MSDSRFYDTVAFDVRDNATMLDLISIFPINFFSIAVFYLQDAILDFRNFRSVEPPQHDWKGYFPLKL